MQISEEIFFLSLSLVCFGSFFRTLAVNSVSDFHHQMGIAGPTTVAFSCGSCMCHMGMKNETVLGQNILTVTDFEDIVTRLRVFKSRVLHLGTHTYSA